MSPPNEVFLKNLIVHCIRFVLKEGHQWSELKQPFILFITGYSIIGKHPSVEDVYAHALLKPKSPSFF